jgi:hypothetical protein
MGGEGGNHATSAKVSSRQPRRSHDGSSGDRLLRSNMLVHARDAIPDPVVKQPRPVGSCQPSGSESGDAGRERAYLPPTRSTPHIVTQCPGTVHTNG